MSSLSADWDSTSDRSSPTDSGSPTDWGSPDRSSPSILEIEPLANSNLGLPTLLLDRDMEPTHQQSNEPSSTQSSDTYTRSYNEHMRETRERLNFAIDDSYLHIGGIVDTAENGIIDMGAGRLQAIVEFEISHSSFFSSASEESNPSSPETPQQDDTDIDEEPPAKVTKIDFPDNNEDLDGETCPICLDTWGNSGNHRLVALKCGHLFGAECVERWLKAQAAKDRSCPTCKSKASLKDLRFIYARKLIAADTSEITKLQKLVDTLQAEKSRTELNLQSAKMTQRALAVQLEDLKKTISRSQAAKQQAEGKSWRFALEKNLEICKDGGCRVLTYNCRTYELYVSQKSSNYLFPGYGIRKVSCVDYTLGQFVHLHPKPIRDITYSQPNDLLLSVALDSTARIVERGIPNVTINAGLPLWSCAWDHHRSNEFYIGGVGGMIHQYDFRNPSTILRTLPDTGDMSPVVSVCSTEYGLLSCQLNSCWLWEIKTGEWVPKPFPVNGAFLSMCYDTESQRALISTRPKESERSKLTVCSLVPAVSGGAEIVVDYVINGSARTSVMSKATFCRTPGASWVAAHSESDATLYLHGLDGSRTMSLPAAEPALDVCSVPINGNSVLAALSESRLRIYRAMQTSG